MLDSESISLIELVEARIHLEVPLRTRAVGATCGRDVEGS